MIMINKRNNLVEDNKPIENKEEKDKENQKEENIGYVSCDDNTALLNVRNSTSGDIIDGLSCYKQVNIEEELEKILTEIIQEINATSMKDIGNIMKAVMPKVKGRADGNMVNNIAKKILN